MPEWLDAELLRQMSVGVLIALGVAALLVFRFVTKMVTRLIFLSVIAVLATGVWLQWENLQDCADDCSCELFGQEVHVPRCEEAQEQFEGLGVVIVG